MLKTPPYRLAKLIAEAKVLEKEGAEAIRVAVKEEKDARLADILKREINTPLVADIHFNHRLAISAIEKGFDGIRLNPLNISKEAYVREVVRCAKKNNISIRIGINSGGFKKNFSSSAALAKEMVRKTKQYLKIFEKEQFFDIMVSLKGSTTLSTTMANELFAKEFDYPLHLGVTATGPFLCGIVKTSIALGELLSKGIGSVIRVSLTAPSFWEIRVAKYILQSLDVRHFGPQIISCPTCSRCEVDLVSIVDNFQKALDGECVKKPLHIAIMGCVVNGPGEAYQADIGAAFGRDKCVIFKKGKVLGQSDEKNIIKDLFKEARKLWM